MSKKSKNSDAKARGGLPKGRAACADASLPINDAAATNHAPTGPSLAAAASLPTIIADIRAYHRERNFAMEQRKRANLALGAYLRVAMGWRKDAPEEDRKRIANAAALVMECGEKVAAGKPHELSDTEEYGRFRSIVEAAVMARAPWDDAEAAATKALERLAVQLPVWESFGKAVRGFGPRSLAVIVGEAGDLSTYPKKGHLWKRMGVAVMGDGTGVADIRQGGLRKNAAAEDWIAHGYNAERRARMFVIGDCLVKNGEHYRAVYLARKEYERAQAEARGLTVAPAAKIPKARAAEFISDGHIHKRAQRYMEKRLLKDLWQAWRLSIHVEPQGHLTRDVAEIPGDRKQTVGEANLHKPAMASLGLPSPQPNARKANVHVPTCPANHVLPTAHTIQAAT